MQHINVNEGNFGNIKDHFEKLNLSKKLVSVLVKTYFDLLSIFCLLPKNVLFFVFKFEKLVQVHTGWCKNLLKIRKLVLMCVSD